MLVPILGMACMTFSGLMRGVVHNFHKYPGHANACATVRAVIRGGTVKSLYKARSRLPATGTSTVSTAAVYPAAFARASISRTKPRSFHTYTCSHLGPEAHAATASMLVVESVDRA